MEMFEDLFDLPIGCCHPQIFYPHPFTFHIHIKYWNINNFLSTLSKMSKTTLNVMKNSNAKTENDLSQYAKQELQKIN